MKAIRFLAVFFLNLLLAAIGPEILGTPFYRYLHLADRSPLAFLKGDLTDAIAAFGLGYFVYRRWRPSASKWVWIAGFCWVTQRALEWRFGDGAGSPHSIFWEMSGNGTRVDVKSGWDWAGYTLPFVRTVFYSAGAFCRSRVGRSGPTLLERAVHRLWEAIVEGFVSSERVEPEENHGTTLPTKTDL